MHQELERRWEIQLEGELLPDGWDEYSLSSSESERKEQPWRWWWEGRKEEEGRKSGFEFDERPEGDSIP